VPARDASNPLRTGVLGWEPSAWERRAMYGQVAALIAGGCAEALADAEQEHVVLPASAPEQLLRLERYEGRYVVYVPCDGVGERLVLRDMLVEHLAGLAERSVMFVQAVTPSRGKVLEVKVTSAVRGCEKDVSLRLTPLAAAGWYRVQMGDAEPAADEVWVTPKAAAGLDVLVNVCRLGKRSEYPLTRGR
jgi:hypothetical protein